MALPDNCTISGTATSPDVRPKWFKGGAPDENESWEEVDDLGPPVPGLGSNDLLPKVIDHEVQVKHLIPPGVASFKQWRRTIVAFGKYQLC